VSEGFDLPAVEVAIMLRPTKSLSLYLQQAGRAIRISPGKEKTVILDHAGNTKMHGFIDDPRDWVLTADNARKKRTDAEVPPAVRSCPTCFAMHRPMPICPKCGHTYQLKTRKVEQREGELVQISRADDAKAAASESDINRRFNVLRSVGRNRGYTHPDKWAFNVICGQESARLAKIRSANGGVTTNGLTLEERSRIWNQTIGKTTASSSR
jgi:ribosomal protein L32